MLKSKLLAIIGATTSVVVAATTALTLAVSGPRNVMSLRTLSDNEAVTYGMSNLFDSATSGVSTVTDVIDTIAENKAQIAMGFNINGGEEIGDELAGVGADFKIQFDAENGQYAISGSAEYGSVELFNALIYMDEKELVAYAPSLFEGVVKVAYDNLAEDIENSYIGSLLVEDGFDFEEYRDEFMTIIEEATESMPAMEYEFDYEDFADGLTETINDAYLEAFKTMNVTDNGKQPLAGGKYQCYTASVSVSELSYIVKDALMYVLESDEFIDYLDYISEYYSSLEDSAYDDYDDYYGDYSDIEDIYGMSGGLSLGDSMAGMSAMLDSYWGMAISEIEAVLGKEIQFTIYLTDSVETAGFEFYISQNADGSFNYSKEAAKAADEAIVIKGDFTGGKEIGDYTYLAVTGTRYDEEVLAMEYSFKMEANGDFNLDFTTSEMGISEGSLHADGSYKEDGMFFSLDVNSLKFTNGYGETEFDIGFNFSFEAIDGVDKPSASPEYDIWAMDEDDFEAFGREIEENIEKLEDLFY